MARLESPRLPPARRTLLLNLLESFESARELRKKLSSFACQLTQLHQHGVTEAAARWAVAQGLAEHHLETTMPGHSRRTFRPVANLCFTPRSCLVPTPVGVRFAESLINSHIARLDPVHDKLSNDKPRNIAAERVLLVYGQVLKRFTRPAQTQELILSCFEEEHWPEHLHDPLPPQSDVNPKQRLHDTIKRLNRAHLFPAIRFAGDGTGRGLRWRHIGPSEAPKRP